MYRDQKINEHIKFVQTVDFIVKDNEQLYTGKMKAIKDSVIKTRNFINDLSEIFHELQYIYQVKNYTTLRVKKNKQITGVSEKNHKTAAVLLTGSKFFSGSINEKVFQSFLTYIKGVECEVVIIGKIGKRLYEEQYKSTKLYTYFDLDEEVKDPDVIKEISQYLIKYTNVNVFYAKYINIINQTESQSKLSEESINPNQRQYGYVNVVNYIFEPSLENIINFFEEQIFQSLLKQSLNESYLAQLGSRIRTLESTTGTIETELNKLSRRRIQLIHRIENKNQFNTTLSYLLV
jgi:F0F1-type ATP synthase gamma subunit